MTPDCRARLLRALALAESAERVAAEFYGTLHDRFADDGEAAALFFRLHAEEKVHLSLARYARRLVLQNPALFDSVELDPEPVQRAARGAGGLMAADPPRELGEAVRTALFLEEVLDEAYLKSRIAVASPLLAKLVETLREPSHGHELLEFARRRGFAPPDGPPATGV